MKTILSLLLLLSVPAFGAEVAGVKLDDKARVGNAELVLNGAGLRKRVVFQVYAMGLYLPKKTTSAAEAISGEGPKRVAIHMLRDVGAAQFTDALADGIRDNHTEVETKAHEPRVKALAATMAELKEAKKGMVIVLDMAGGAVQMSIDGKPAGKPIDGSEFSRALLRIWLGDKPVQDDLKKALLGGG
jgi:Chalcone isomerase-like